ncbi:hypothetical protein HKBW3S34_02444, partial [Candidatus Hakubella thermalkaliphila]
NGITTDKTEMSSILRGLRRGPKVDNILRECVDILRKYELGMAAEKEA